MFWQFYYRMFLCNFNISTLIYLVEYKERKLYLQLRYFLFISFLGLFHIFQGHLLCCCFFFILFINLFCTKFFFHVFAQSFIYNLTSLYAYIILFLFYRILIRWIYSKNTDESLDECRQMQTSVDESLDECKRMQTSHQTSVDECRQVNKRVQTSHQTSVDESRRVTRLVETNVEESGRMQTSVNESKKTFLDINGG